MQTNLKDQLRPVTFRTNDRMGALRPEQKGWFHNFYHTADEDGHQTPMFLAEDEKGKMQTGYAVYLQFLDRADEQQESGGKSFAEVAEAEGIIKLDGKEGRRIDIPDVEQLVEVIRQGDDSFINTVVLKTNGFFELRQDAPHDLNADPEVVTRFESFMAGNGYVGEGAANDESFIKNTYRALMEDWLIHLRNGRVGMHTDEALMPEHEYIKEFETVTGKKYIKPYSDAEVSKQ